jgi:hypothetical protein
MKLGIGDRVRAVVLAYESAGRAVARVHFVDLAVFSRAKSTLGPYSVHFVDLAKIRMTKSTLCTLTAAGSTASPPSRR